jgi:DNA polymerase III gamma/tau subunit
MTSGLPSPSTGAMGDGGEPLFNESVAVPSWARGARKRGCDAGGGYAADVDKAQQQWLIQAQQQVQQAKQAQQRQPQQELSGPQAASMLARAQHQHARDQSQLQHHSAQLQLLQAHQAQPRATMQPHSKEVEQLLKEASQRPQEVPQASKQAPKQAVSTELKAMMWEALADEREEDLVLHNAGPSQEFEADSQPRPCLQDLAALQSEQEGDCGPSRSQPPPLRRNSSMGCGSESEVLAIDDILDVLDSFWSEPARALGKNADADASVEPSTSNA